MSEFKINQIVKGKVAGTFVIVGFRTISNESYAQLKSYENGNVCSGELSLPLNAIEKIN